MSDGRRNYTISGRLSPWYTRTMADKCPIL
jgi:hypothetical protein